MKQELKVATSNVEVMFHTRHTGHRFWIYIFNHYVTLALFVLIVWLVTESTLWSLFALLVVGVFMLTTEIDEGWYNVTKWRDAK